MLFLCAALIIAASCSLITIRTLIGYSDMHIASKILISSLILLGWFGIFPIHLMQKANIPDAVFAPVSFTLYTLMGFVFILFVTLILRDIVWFGLYGAAKALGIGGWHLNPKNLSSLSIANMIVVIFSILLTGYALYEGHKEPEVKDVFIYSDKISKNLRIAQISDMHITRATPDIQVRKLVHQVNGLNPDVVVLTGDTIDDTPSKIEDKLFSLRELSAPYGVYVIMGNHEFYNDIYASKKLFDKLGLKFLFNGGFHINKSNVFIAGIPDMGTMVERINLWRALNKSTKEDYKILLSHTPTIVDGLSRDLVDLVLSGHTHGGQIFPFHILVKQANKYLAGQYKVNDIDLYVSRGVGTCGPTMRLFAPSDIVMINLLKK